MEPEKKFSLLNFFYGLGAAIILIAALFKFVGWREADTLFIVGLVGEAIIFLISGALPVMKAKSFNWEKVFPQLQDEQGTNVPGPTLASAEFTQEEQVKKIIESIVSLNNSVENLNSATLKLTNTVGKLEENYETVSEATMDYQKEINSLKIKIAGANQKLKEFENFKF
jgi:gliding motility-associated protein GldL